jgi:hypothetical protein
MPAPPSSKQKAANQASMNASKAKSNSFGGINTSTVKTSSKSSSNSFGSSNNNNSSFFGGINTNKVKTNSQGSMNSFGPSSKGLLSGTKTSYPTSPGGMFGGINTNLLGSVVNQVSPLMQKAQDRARSAMLKDQYSQYRSPQEPAEDLTRNAYMADQYSKYRSPPNVNQMAPQQQGLNMGITPTQARVAAISRGPGTLQGYLPNALPSQTRQTDFMFQNAFNDKTDEDKLNPGYAPTGIDGLVSPSQAAQDQAALERRALAVSRGPGSVAGVMPGASPLSQQRTIGTLAGAMSEGGFPMSPSDLQKLSQTIAGEAGNQGPMGQTAVGNTMLNRMSLAASDPDKYGYMGGGDINSLMGQYDATGMRKGTTPNSAFQGAQLGTDALGEGIASMAGAASTNSLFNTTQPAAIKNATHFYNPQVSNPKWGGPGFSPLGDHVFGNAEPTAGQVASLRAQPPAASPPTQTASISPAVAPPTPQPPAPEQGAGFWDSLYQKGAEAVNYVDQNLVQPTQEQVAKYGGFERAGKLAQMAVGIMNFLPGGEGLANKRGDPSRTGAAGDVMGGRGTGVPGAPPPSPSAPVTPTSPAAPAAPPPAQWFYPQYTQGWANPPTGAGGPIWQPSAPAPGLFPATAGAGQGANEHQALLQEFRTASPARQQEILKLLSTGRIAA